MHLYINAECSAHFAVMAWKTFVLVILTNIILSDSQEELEATQAPSLWTWMAGSATSPASWTEDTISRVAGTESSLEHAGNGGNTHTCDLYSIITCAVVPCIIGFGGLVCNLLSILTFWPDRHKSATSVLLLQLAVVDSLVLIIWSILCVIWVMANFADNPSSIVLTANLHAYKYGYGIGNTIHMIAVWLVIYITVQRYVAVCHPHKMRLVSQVKVAWIQLAVLVIFCLLFNIPRFLEFEFVVLENNELGLQPAWFVKTEAFQIYYLNVSFYLFVLVIPVSLLIIFTACLIRHLKKSNQIKMKSKSTNIALVGPRSANGTASSQASTQANAHHTKKEKSITFSLVIVDIVALCCQIFLPLRRLMEFLLPLEEKVCGKPYFYFDSLTVTGLFINSSINFIIYCLCSQGFKKKMYERLKTRTNAVHSSSSK